MAKHVDRRSVAKLMAASAIGLAGFGVSQSNAAVVTDGVMIDVRAMQLNGQPSPDPKHVEYVWPGDVVTLYLFAIVTGTNGLDDEGFQVINGSIRSSTGGLRGNLAAQLVVPFNGSGSSPGSMIDVDSDGDVDVSGPDPALSGGYFWPRTFPAMNFGTRIGADSEEFLIAVATFTVTDTSMGSTVVNYFQHRTSSGGNNIGWGMFQIDGNTGGARDSTNTAIGSDGVVIGIPEPSALALAGIGALGLLARRRKNA